MGRTAAPRSTPASSTPLNSNSQPLTLPSTQQVDQAELETVVPQPGGTVLVLNGPHRGLKGSLLGIDTKRFQAEVQLRGGAADGRSVWLDYDHFSRWEEARVFRAVGG